MISKTTRGFQECYQALPRNIQSIADKAYKLWLSDPRSPDLQFKCVDPQESIFSVRVGKNYRALRVLKGDTIVWYWIGKHDLYERLLREAEPEYFVLPNATTATDTPATATNLSPRTHY
jgi:hypothetical protein